MVETEFIETSLYNLFKSIYDIKKDDANLRKILNEQNAGKYFDTLRKEYNLRYEFPNFSLIVPKEKKIKSARRRGR